MNVSFSNGAFLMTERRSCSRVRQGNGRRPTGDVASGEPVFPQEVLLNTGLQKVNSQEDIIACL